MERPLGICFDLFHTLIDVNSAPGPSSSEVLGIDPFVWNRKLMGEAPHHALGTEKDPYESIRRIAHSIDPSLPEETIRDAVVRRPHRFRHALLSVRGEVLSVLSALRAGGLRLALISNAGLDEIEAWEESPLALCFDAALFSCHEGLMKPDPRFYRLAAERLGVPPGRCWFVGDGGSDEHEGARRAGMTTVLTLGFLRESLPELAESRPRNTDFVIQDLGELLSLPGLSGVPPGPGEAAGRSAPGPEGT